MDLSIVMPCLNESETLETCINKAKTQIEKLNINGEIIVADNGSTDGSIQIAKKNGANVINVSKKGYGIAVRSGIQAATGKYILIADADDSYDLNDIPKFLNKISEGFDLVQGCRLPIGGGKISKDAMPLSHKYIGNPFFSYLTKKFYNVPFNDVYCGMKIIRKETLKKINFFSSGMVFCLEILIKYCVNKLKVSEVPITLYKDGRIKGKSHLKTISDGLKTLKFLLIFTPKWVYFFPSIFFLISSIVLIFFSIKNIFVLDIFGLYLVSSFLIFLSIQIFMLGLYSTLRAESLGFIKDNNMKKFFNFFSLRKSLFFNLTGIFFTFLMFFTNYINLLDDQNSLLLSTLFVITFITLIFNSFFIALLRIDE